jgi:hypothetical protein
MLLKPLYYYNETIITNFVIILNLDYLVLILLNSSYNYNIAYFNNKKKL